MNNRSTEFKKLPNEEVYVQSFIFLFLFYFTHIVDDTTVNRESLA